MRCQKLTRWFIADASYQLGVSQYYCEVTQFLICGRTLRLLEDCFVVQDFLAVCVTETPPS